MTHAAWLLLDLVNLVVILYFIGMNAMYLVTTVVSFRFLRRYVLRLKSVDVEELIRAGAALPVTVVAPAFNEEATCVEAVRSFLTLQYPEYEIVLVNDGSTDGTFERLRNAFDLAPSPRLRSAAVPTAPVRGVYRSRRYRSLWVVDKHNGGKADAINAGFNVARTPLVCVVDADSLLEREALLRVTRPFLEDARTVAAGGVVRIANGCTVRSGVVQEVHLPRNLLARIQILEYLRAFLTGRVGWAELNATLIISGAFGMFRRDVVTEAGGFATDTVGEDMELVVRIHRYCRERRLPYRIVFVPDPVAWTECPETLRSLGRQRDRWQRGMIESLLRHERMLLNPKYGMVGMLAFPHFFFLEMMGPGVEFLGYLSFGIALGTGRASMAFTVAFLSLAVLLGIALSLAAIGLEELTFRRFSRWSELRHLIWLSILENAGFRQLSTVYRVRGILRKLRGRTDWGAHTRKGFSTTP